MPLKIKDPVAHFWTRVGPPKEKGCREWLGGLDGRKHYGCLGFNGRIDKAHRVSYFITYGSLNGLCVLHKCDNMICVEPTHLFLGTQEENIKDMVEKGRQASACGEKHGMSKLTSVSVDEIREHRKNGIPVKEIAVKYGVHWSTIYNVCKTWGVPYLGAKFKTKS